MKINIVSHILIHFQSIISNKDISKYKFILNYLFFQFFIKMDLHNFHNPIANRYINC